MEAHLPVIRFALSALSAAVLVTSACGDASNGETRTTTIAPDDSQRWIAGPSLPQPTTNNAVAAVDIDGRVSVFSFLGLDSTKIWSGVTNVAYRWDVGDDAWRAIEPVPGPGRLASTAQAVDGLIYVIGGYTVAEDGAEKSVPDVNVYDPIRDSWSRAADIPVPSDDAVAGVWRGDRILLVSGWHDSGNIRDVQIFDPGSDSWTEATSIPGRPVFGHTGAVAGDQVVYVDGAAVVAERPRFVIEESSWVGALDPSDPSSINWTSILQHPGRPLYRAAAATVGDMVLFIGGTDNPYNYSGIGYDGAPSEPLRQLLAYAPERGLWRQLPALPVATMDHRNAGVAGGMVFVVGGMVEGQEVSDHVWYVEVSRLLGESR